MLSVNVIIATCLLESNTTTDFVYFQYLANYTACGVCGACGACV